MYLQITPAHLARTRMLVDIPAGWPFTYQAGDVVLLEMLEVSDRLFLADVWRVVDGRLDVKVQQMVRRNRC